MRFTISGDGLDRFRQNIRAITRATGGRNLAHVVEAGALICEAEAKIRAPVDLGTLRASIGTTVRAVTNTAADAFVGPTVHYGPYVEFGTGVFAERGDGRRTPWKYFNPRWQRWVRTVGNWPQPYLRPALREGKPKIVTAMQTAFKGLLALAGHR